MLSNARVGDKIYCFHEDFSEGFYEVIQVDDDETFVVDIEGDEVWINFNGSYVGEEYLGVKFSWGIPTTVYPERPTRSFRVLFEMGGDLEVSNEFYESEEHFMKSNRGISSLKFLQLLESCERLG